MTILKPVTKHPSLTLLSEVCEQAWASLPYSDIASA